MWGNAVRVYSCYKPRLRWNRKEAPRNPARVWPRRQSLLMVSTSLFFLTVLPPNHTSLGEGNGNPLQYSCLANPMDGGAWWAAVHRVTRSRTWLSNFTFTFHFHALEKEMATHSSLLAWRIPGTGEPDGLPSLESHRVGHDWSDSAAAAAVAFLISSVWCKIGFQFYCFHVDG